MPIITNRVGGLSTTTAAYNKVNAVNPVAYYSFSGNPNSPSLDKDPSLDINQSEKLANKSRLQREQSFNQLKGENKAPSFSILA